jgi:hypothetical protein
VPAFADPVCGVKLVISDAHARVSTIVDICESSHAREYPFAWWSLLSRTCRWARAVSMIRSDAWHFFESREPYDQLHGRREFKVWLGGIECLDHAPDQVQLLPDLADLGFGRLDLIHTRQTPGQTPLGSRNL